MRLFFSLLLILALPFSTAKALQYEEGGDAPMRTLEDFIADFVDVAKGGIDWKLLGQTKVIDINIKDENGFDVQYQKPEFSEAVKVLDKTKIRLRGYMFPLDSVEEQSQFLFGPFPLNCPFQYHVTPALVVEVHPIKDFPITFSYDPMTIEGDLELVPEDKEFSTFYRLKNVRLIKE
jgi:hypothetical protein